MQLAQVIGRATATVKHASLDGQRLLILQPLTVAGGNDGDPVLAIDDMGATKGSTVIITTDAKHGAELTSHKNSPVRFSVIGLPDERSTRPSTPTQKELFTWGA